MAEENKDIVEGLSKVTAKLSTTNQTLDDVKDKIIEGSQEEAEQFNELFDEQAKAQTFNANLGKMNADIQRIALNKIISDNEKFAEDKKRAEEKAEGEKVAAQAKTDAAARKALGISQSRLELARSMDEKIKEQEKALKVTADILKEEGKDIKDSKQYRKQHIELLKTQKERAQVIGSKTAEDKADKELKEQKQLTLLGKMASGIGSMAERTKEAVKKTWQSLKGFLFAGFALAALMFMNHPKFKEMKDFLIDTLVPILVFLYEKIIKPIGLWLGGKIKNLFLSIKDAIDGKKGWWGVLMENKAILGLIIAGLALKVLGFKGILAIIKMLPAAMTAISGGFSAILAPLSALLAPLLIPIAIIAGIALAIYAIKEAFDAFKFELEATGSVWEAVKTFLLKAIMTFFIWPFEKVKEGFSWIIGKIGSIFGIQAFKDAETLLDKIKFVESIEKGLIWLGNFISGLWDNFKLSIVKKGGILGNLAKRFFGTEEEIKAKIAAKKKEQEEFAEKREILSAKKKEDESKFAKMRAEATKKSREELGISEKKSDAEELEKLKSMISKPGAGTDIHGGIEARRQAAAPSVNIVDDHSMVIDNKQSSTTISQLSTRNPSAILNHILTAA